jgi:hypothetical protein
VKLLSSGTPSTEGVVALEFMDTVDSELVSKACRPLLPHSTRADETALRLLWRDSDVRTTLMGPWGDGRTGGASATDDAPVETDAPRPPPALL